MREAPRRHPLVPSFHDAYVIEVVPNLRNFLMFLVLQVALHPDCSHYAIMNTLRREEP